MAIAELRYSDLKTWECTKKAYIDRDATALFDAINATKTIRQNDFQSLLQDSLITKKMNVKDFAEKNYKRFSRKKNARIIYPELGKAFEQSGRFVNACKFYEWATDQTDEPDLKRFFEERWVVCKERQAENDDNEQYRKDALDKRKQLGIVDKTLSIGPTLTNESWENLFSFYLKVSNEVRIEQQEKSNENFTNKIVETHNQSILGPITNGISNSSKTNSDTYSNDEFEQTDFYIDTFKFSYDKYNIVYRQRRSELELRDEDECCGKFMNGTFSNEDDFILKEGRVYYRESGKTTPFIIKINNKTITFKIEQNE